MTKQGNPTAAIQLNYERFVQSREARINQHMVGGIPDYAFSLDYTIRQQLNQIPFLRKVVEGLLSLRVPLLKIQYEESGIVVGPDQFPQIYDMSVKCAKILGMPVPNIYIESNRSPNAFTFATGHSDQIIVVTSGLLESLNEKELQYVIGHECGHIHNRHVVYNTLWEILTNQVARSFFVRLLLKFGPSRFVFELLQLAFTTTTSYLFGRWHRCAEITCDRAGLICIGDVVSAMNVPARLRLPGATDLDGFNPDAYKNQMQNWNRSFFRLGELLMSHPPGPQRAFAIERFSFTDVYRSWRPELEFSEPAIPLTQIDEEISSLFT
ncbi:MAG: M48 family metallopeptidase [Myxococcota bacterium]|nr:M48 family metallopeptidase [Myxococcota bacterium]